MDEQTFWVPPEGECASNDWTNEYEAAYVKLFEPTRQAFMALGLPDDQSDDLAHFAATYWLAEYWPDPPVMG